MFVVFNTSDISYWLLIIWCNVQHAWSWSVVWRCRIVKN